MKKTILTLALGLLTACAFSQSLTVEPIALRNLGPKNTSTDWRAGLQFSEFKYGRLKAGLVAATDTRGSLPLYLGAAATYNLLPPKYKNFEFGPAFGWTAKFDDLKHLGTNGQFGLGLRAQFTVKF